MKTTLEAIENVIDKRSTRGASNKSLIAWLLHLKTIHLNITIKKGIDELISAIQQTPLK